MANICQGKTKVGGRCKTIAKYNIFCYHHQNQILEQKSVLDTKYLDNIGVLPPDIEKIVGEYADPDTYLKLIIHNPKIHTHKKYQDKKVNSKKMLWSEFDKIYDQLFNNLLNKLYQDNSRSKDYLFLHYTLSESSHYSDFKYNTFRELNKFIKNNKTFRKKIGIVNAHYLLNKRQMESEEKIKSNYRGVLIY